MPVFVSHKNNKLYNKLYLNKITTGTKLRDIPIIVKNTNTRDIINFNKFACAGFLIYSNKYVILGFNRWRKTYEDFSGKRDIIHDNIEQTAVSELFEESSGTILLQDISDVTYINVPVVCHRRITSWCRLYLLKITDAEVNLFLKYFKENRKLMQEKNLKNFHNL